MAKARPVTGLNAHASTGENGRLIARTRLDEFYNWDQYVDNPYHIRELHNLRIAAKRLRYTLEIFAEALPESVAPFLKEVERIQDELGSLHDSDVMIALLRLCMGAQDGGAGYEYVLAHARELKKKADFVINPAMVAYVLDPSKAPSADERRGLESLLQDLRRRRDDQYTSFRQHWYELKARDFRHALLGALDSSSGQ
jgi:hypothetical protein